LGNVTEVINTNSSFVEDIEKICRSHGVDVLDAAITWCEQRGVEVETVAALIKRDFALKTRLQAEAEAAHTIKQTGARLPI
jgi:TusA-related sulfurtransferase